MDAATSCSTSSPGFGRSPSSNVGPGSLNVSFVDKVTEHDLIVTDMTAAWGGPPAGDNWTPGGQMGGLLGVSDARRHDRRLPEPIDDRRPDRHQVNAAYGGSFFTVGTAGGAAGRPAPDHRPDFGRAGTGAAGSNDIALAVPSCPATHADRRRLQGLRREGRLKRQPADRQRRTRRC
jgi:hypothetical protein